MIYTTTPSNQGKPALGHTHLCNTVETLLNALTLQLYSLCITISNHHAYLFKVLQQLEQILQVAHEP